MLYTLSLDGSWRLRGNDGIRLTTKSASQQVVDESKWLDATVPGEVHLDLWRAGRIQDPYVGDNVLSCRWVEESIWTYRRTFDVPADAIEPGVRSWLCFEGLDYAATILLNGVEIGTHANSFYPSRLEVTGKLTAGQNLLVIHLDSGLHYVTDKPAEAFCFSPDQRLHKRHWLRKPQCQFGWDWSPRLINVGIHKPVRLEWTSAPIRPDQFVALATVSEDLKTGRVSARFHVEGTQQQPVEANLRIRIRGTTAQTSKPVSIQPGMQTLEASLELASPDLWWPVGHGDQPLYTVEARIESKGETLAETTTRVGFRHVRINQEPHPKEGSYFIVEVNHRRIFCKGGNFVPADMIFARIDRKRYTGLIALALEQHFNMLRVWGGGLYEADAFYELCDEAGILVWQEFVYACSRYPFTDEAFHCDTIAEARYNVRRLASHPSLVIWCGNNEIEMFDWIGDFAKTGAILPDYGFFHLTLPRLLQDEDPTRFYHPSSPFSPNHAHPLLDHVGDQHPWGVGFHNVDFRDYRKMICRFPNEGGMLGPTALPTMLASLGPDLRDHLVGSFSWQQHDNAVDGWADPSPVDAIVRHWLNRDPREMSIADFTYWAGLIHGEALREYIENFRRRMFDAAAAIFWMYNDTWPAVRSWTTVDYYLRRTPAFWSVRRAMTPVRVVVAEEDNHVAVFGVNDTPHTIRGTLRYGVFNLCGGPYPVDHTVDAVLPPNASVRLAEMTRSLWIDPSRSAAFALLADGDGRLISRNRLFLPLFHEIHWPQAVVHVRPIDDSTTFTSDAFAWGVCLDLCGEHALPDNFFDVWPGIPFTLTGLHGKQESSRIANGRLDFPQPTPRRGRKDVTVASR